MPDVRLEGELLAQPREQRVEHIWVNRDHPVTIPADQVEVFVVADRVVRRSAVAEVGVPDQAQLLEDLPHVRRVHVVRYEDLVRDPDAVVGRAFAFLGLEDVNAGRAKAEGVNADNFQADRTLRTGVNDKYFAEWRHRRRGLLPRAYYTAIERRHERAARKFGYSLVHPEELHEPTVPLPGLDPVPGTPQPVTA